MELRHLRYFVAVAEELHFGRAAERLHMAQPPLSQQIRQLEAELGVALFTRTTRQVALTPAGARYLERTRAVLAAVDQAGVEAARVDAGEVGRVSIGFIGSATYSLLPQLARDLRAALPDIEVDVKGEMLTPDQVLALRDGTIDIALMRTPVPHEDIEVFVVRREPLVVALPSTHPLAEAESVRVRDLRDEPFVTYPSEHRSVLHDTVLAACQRAGFSPRKAVQVAETSTLVVFVAAGLGVALVPESVSALQLSGVTFRPLTDNATVELAIGWHPERRTPAVDRVLEQLRISLADDPKST
ncbi:MULTISPECIES: LysR substrate-binding domain-containing protein [unclassified Nocardioides]|uniref:LysR substrate-binding domain-containing protein n=1 Tax=unclassified Nocardioides TaxID=2615069 RepID=UPI0006F39AF5|nr:MULTISPECIES: LysR substrate-binding domain-containing protein [unclassified Nocardioides]KQY56862.1 LysR family transcriptional regulator [Nocardioides sp. Root140]KQZ66942.1 LysR family transcriptional regulator [Nocardioides sp. Root151]KRF12984.1 LysR family transcriptional regulator [Nocardioides sp. Soil796]